jgi:hypothetical protein
MFYLLKHILLLILVIFKLKCNDLIFNEILVLYASNMCLLHSHFIENHPIWILEDEPLISKVVLSQAPPHHASHRQPSVQSGSSSFALAHAEQGPRPRPSIHHTSFLSLFVAEFPPVRAPFRWEPLSRLARVGSSVAARRPNSLVHFHDGDSPFPSPMSRRVPRQVVHPTAVTARRCALPMRRARSRHTPTAPDGVGCPKGLRLGQWVGLRPGKPLWQWATGWPKWIVVLSFSIRFSNRIPFQIQIRFESCLNLFKHGNWMICAKFSIQVKNLS